MTRVRLHSTQWPGRPQEDAQSPVAQSAGEPQWGESRDRLALPGSPGANRVGGPSSGKGPGCEDWALGKGLGGRTGLWGRVFSLL